MTFEEAKEELGLFINRKGQLDHTDPYIFWHGPGHAIILDGGFDEDTLMAIAVYMKEYKA